MRRPTTKTIVKIAAIFAALATANTEVQAQTTARPLPAISMGVSTWTASSFNPSASIGTAAPAGYNPTTGQSFKPTSVNGTEDFGSLEIFATARGSADLRGTAGSIEVQRGGFDALIGRRTPGSSAWALHIANESSFYAFDSSTALVPGTPRPFNDLYETSLGLQLAATSSDKISWLGGFEVTMAGEDLVDPTDSLIIGGLAGARYALTENAGFSFGLAGESRLSDDAWVMPFFGMDWQLGENSRFEIQGSEISFNQGLTENVSFNLGAVYDIRQFRLNDSSAVSGGVFRDEEIRVTAGIDWTVSEAAKLSFEVGQVMWNELAVLNSGGAEIGMAEANKSPFIGFSLRFGL